MAGRQLLGSFLGTQSGGGNSANNTEKSNAHVWPDRQCGGRWCGVAAAAGALFASASVLEAFGAAPAALLCGEAEKRPVVAISAECRVQGIPGIGSWVAASRTDVGRPVAHNSRFAVTRLAVTPSASASGAGESAAVRLRHLASSPPARSAAETGCAAPTPGCLGLMVGPDLQHRRHKA